MWRSNKVRDIRNEDEIPLAYAEEDEFPKYGQPRRYDPDFRGPIEERSSTDVACCLLFLACISGLGYVAFIAWSTGDPATLVYPTDYLGRVCGRDESVRDKPYLLHFDLSACTQVASLVQFSCSTPQICVKVCPNVTYVAAVESLTTQNGPTDWEHLYCLDDFDPEKAIADGMTLAEIFDRELCASFYFRSKPYFHRCVPAFIVDSFESMDDIFSNTTVSRYTVNATVSSYTVNATGIYDSELNVQELKEVFKLLASALSVIKSVTQDILKSYKVILLGWILGMVLSMLYILLMRWFAGVMIWASLTIVLSVLSVGTSYCFYHREELSDYPGADEPIEFKLEVTALVNNLHRRQTWMILGCINGFVLLIFLCITLCLCVQIRIAIALIKESSRAVGHMMSTLIWPLFPFAVMIVVTLVWLVISVYLASSHVASYVVMDLSENTESDEGTACNPKNFTASPNSSEICQFVRYGLPDRILHMQFFNFFMLFWLINFAIALGQMTLAGAYASYYFAFTKPCDIPSRPLYKSFCRSIRYHLGSLAFGSLIIALIQTIRLILEYVEKKLKGRADNQVAKYVIKCLKCVFCILEKLLKFINKNAYILIAIYGDNFCKSAKNAFFLLMRNILRVTVVNKLTYFVIFLGELTIAAILGVLSFFYFKNKISPLSDILPIPNVTLYWGPIVAICAGTFILAKCLFSVFDMAVDTLFLCFLEDLERNDGSASRPYYMSRGLKSIVLKRE